MLAEWHFVDYCFRCTWDAVADWLDLEVLEGSLCSAECSGSDTGHHLRRSLCRDIEQFFTQFCRKSIIISLPQTRSLPLTLSSEAMSALTTKIISLYCFVLYLIITFYKAIPTAWAFRECSQCEGSREKRKDLRWEKETAELIRRGTHSIERGLSILSWKQVRFTLSPTSIW